MKTVILILATLSLCVTSLISAKEKRKMPAAQQVNTRKSTVKWTGKHVVGSQHTGNVNIKNGVLHVENGKLTGGTLEIDMASLTCTDIQSADDNQKLVRHLKDNDFFAVDKYPTAVFKIVKVAYDKSGANITGNLTIKGVTHPITFSAVIKAGKDRTEATATVAVDRSKYHIRYESPSFFNNLGDSAISDEFVLTIALVTGL